MKNSYVQCMVQVLAEHPEEAISQQRMEIEKGAQKKDFKSPKIPTPIKILVGG